MYALRTGKAHQAHICIIVLRMCMLGIQIAVRSLDRERDSRIISDLVQEPAASKKDVLAPMKVMMVLGDPGRKVVAFIMKVQLQLQMFHQIGFECDRREMMDIGTVFMKLWMMAAFRQPPFVVIAEHHPCMVRHVPHQMRSRSSITAYLSRQRAR